MLAKVLRYPGIFAQAVVMTLRGQQVTRRYGKLLDWIERASALTQAALTEADKHGVDEAARRTIVVRVDGRDQDMDTILKTVQFHADHEFQYMLSNPTEHTLTGIYALNMNDMYTVTRLSESDEIAEPVRQTIKELSQHLSDIPSSNALEN